MNASATRAANLRASRRTASALAIATTCLSATHAFAQQTAATTASSAPAIEEIIVTAQRREESIQKVPVAVTAIGAKQLADLRVDSLRDIAGLAPSLQMNTQGMQSNPTIIIRGVASGTSSNSVDPKVGIYIDGVYIGRSTGSLLDFSDIARLEVLRGPQGTLFGRNATSGAISVTTSVPKGDWAFNGTVSYGNYNAFRAKLSLDLPKIGPFSVRVAYLHDQIDGDVTNTLAGQTLDVSQRAPEFGTLKYVSKLGSRNVDGGQIAVRGEFGNVTADYRFDYTDSNASARAMQSLGVIPDASGQLLAPIVALQPYFGGTTNSSPGMLRSVANATSNEHTVTQGHSLTLNWHLSDNVTIKSITAYREFRQDPVIFDLGSAGGLRFTFGQLGALITPGLTAAQIQAALFAPANLPGPHDYFFPLLSARATSQKQFTQELQLQASRGPLQLTAGLFYFAESAPDTEVLGILEPVPNGTIVPSPFDAAFGSGDTRTYAQNYSVAGYGQLTWHLSDTVDLTGGLRGTFDKRHLALTQISTAEGGNLGVGDYRLAYSKVTYTAIATWRPTNDATLYAKTASGYVSGGILSGIPFRPENLVSYEVGSKTEFFQHRLRVNLAAYYNNYTDLQTQNFINGVQFFDNAGKAHIDGFEAEVEVAPARGLTLSGSLSYTDFTYKTFVLVGVDVASVARPTYFSNWTGRAAATYNSPALSAGGPHLTGLLEARYRSSYYLTSTPEVNVLTGQNALEDVNHRPGYWLVNGRIGLADLAIGGTRATLSAFGDNLLDKHYINFGAPVLLLTGMYDRGRTYGVELGVRF
ncbi:TonB-dependent receptor [Novosphingobium sp.]|uniref:TonB-dependent receptor n=1 Tax=Novosphingobium sp. TaxID=1874826 RepID=UPI003B51B0F4